MSAAPARRARVADQVPLVRVPQHQRIVLANGVALIVMPRPEIPLISFSAILRGGGMGDPPGKAGLASLTAGLLERGAGERDALAFAQTVEGAGGTFFAAAGHEAISIGGQFLSRDQDLLLNLLADALTDPRFDPSELELLRSRQIEQIKALKDSDPSELLPSYGRALLFGEHLYGRSVIGSEASLARITHEDVLHYAEREIGANRLTLIFVGDLDAAELIEYATRAFGSWRRAPSPALPVSEPARLPGRRVLLVDAPESTQAYFWIGSLGVDKQFPQRAALDIANTIFGGRFTSMLNSELRMKSGLSYGATSGFARGSRSGEFSIRSYAESDKAVEAIDLAVGTLAHLKRQGISREQLESSQTYLLGQFPLGLETSSDWAAALSEIELYHLGLPYIEGYGPALKQVRVPDAARVIRQVFPEPEDISTVLIGDAARLRESAARYGEVAEMKLTDPEFFRQGVARAR